MDGSVVGALEFTSIAVGIEALDAMLKAAPVTVVQTLTICPGRFVVIVSGDVASVEAAVAAGKAERNPDDVLDGFFLPNLHPSVVPAIRRDAGAGKIDSVGIVEALSVSSGIEAADAAVKSAEVLLLRIRLLPEMGGKSLVTLTGSMDCVEQAVESAAELVRRKGFLLSRIVIARPHDDLRAFFLGRGFDGLYKE